jgi:hypothetical protein
MKNRHLYPKNWPELARQCRERAGGVCELCHVAQGDERVSRRGNVYKVSLQACHVDHSQRQQEDAPLLCLCAICHWWHDFEQWQLEQWRKLERAKHLRLLSRERIEQARQRACQRARVAA